jgi:peptide/nickel transport system substrate-binding protein
VLAVACAASCGGDDDDTAEAETPVEAETTSPATPGTEASDPSSSTAPPEAGPATSEATTDSVRAGGAVPGQAGPLADIDGEIAEDGVLRYAHSIAPSQGLDPHLSSQSQDVVWMAPVYEALITELPDASLAPGLATSWEFVDDDTALVMELREGVTFHDGAAFDADVVKANIERAQSIEGSSVVGMIAVIDSVEVVDPLTVRFNLNGPAATLPRNLSDRAGMMISPNSLDDPDLANKPVGAGMYEVREYRPGDRLVLDRFDEYWNPEWNRLAELEIIQMVDSTTRLNALRSGEVDLAILNATEYTQARDIPTLETQQFESTNIVRFGPNRTKAGQDDVRVRQALMYGLDREAIVQAIWGEYAEPTSQWYGPSFPAGYVPELDDAYPHDPEKARALLAEAGYADGLDIEMLVAQVFPSDALAQIAQAQWAEIGVNVTLRTVEPSATASTFYGELVGDVVTGNVTGRTDPAMMLALFFDPNSFTNPGGHVVPEILEAYEKTLVPLPDEERIPLLHDLVRASVEQAGSYNIARPDFLLAGTPEVAGFHYSLRGQPDFRGTGMLAES